MIDIEWAHRQPEARVVERIDFLRRLVRGKRTIHVGFTDAGYGDLQRNRGSWLHARLAESASALVGLDLDAAGVEAAKNEGYEAYVVDCSDAGAVRDLGLQRAEMVVAGEVIEHLGTPGPFLRSMHVLVTETGALVVTTPNAYALLNPVAAIGSYEVIHPDHVSLYSWYTLSNLLEREGWRVESFLTYLLPPIPHRKGRPLRRRVEVAVAKGVLLFQRFLAKAGAPYVADGLIAVCRRREGYSGTED